MLFKFKPTLQQEFFQEPFFLWEKQNVDLLKTKLCMVRIISVKLPGWEKMKLQQSFQIAVMSCFDLRRKANFRRFASDVVVLQNTPAFPARSG